VTVLAQKRLFYLYLNLVKAHPHQHTGNNRSTWRRRHAATWNRRLITGAACPALRTPAGANETARQIRCSM